MKKKNCEVAEVEMIKIKKVEQLFLYNSGSQNVVPGQAIPVLPRNH